MKLTLPVSLLLLIVSIAGAEESGEAFYRDRVHPILEENCFRCHGREDHLRGEFRLTSRAGLLRGGQFGPGYDGENPEKSLLLEMVSYKDEHHQMPPRAKLPDAELAILQEWIRRGAPYDPELEIRGAASELERGFTISEDDRDLWAYRPLNRTGPPPVAEGAWVANAVDQFVLARLEEAGLRPIPDAPAAALVRRVYYDVIGLPPTPGQVRQFVSASAEDPEKAYAELVEKLLASPHFGEKWARHWLDLVRYAESNGFERDNPKPQIWKYRDYVIDAFNADLPYDRFIIEQLAGDEIEDRTRDSLAATGYHRLMQWDDEPADRKQHAYDLLADNVLVTSETFLATTLGCARCHDHKADPFSQKDYYSFMSFFHGVTHYQTPGTIHHWADAAEKAAFEQRRGEKLASLRSEQARLERELRGFLDRVASDEKSGGGGGRELVRDGREENPSSWVYTVREPSPDWKEVGFRDKMWYAGKGGFGRGSGERPVRTPWDSGDIWMRAHFGLEELPGRLVLEICHDDDVEVYLNGFEIHRGRGSLPDYRSIRLGPEAIDVLQTGRNVLAIRGRNRTGAPFIDAGLRTAPRDSRKIEAIVAAGGGKELISRIEAHFGRDLYGEYLALEKEIGGWESRTVGEPLNVVQERGREAPPLHVHLRGSAHAPGERVDPAFPAVFGAAGNAPIPAMAEPVSWDGGESSGRRLALAKWIASSDHPLTARVAVNRVWQHYFGRGIVPTSSDFGALGEKPTHPLLLDWLAARFIDDGWGMKDLHRLILHSRSYRMSSEPDSHHLEKDPTNRLFWRNNMRRLTAEELRDSILAVSGELERKVGGPWVYPPLPEAVLATASRPGKGWPISPETSDHFRRSLYIHVKRSLRHPMMADFDQAQTDSPCAVRFSTTVSNQALMMLNSRFVNERAASLSERVGGGADSVEARIASALELVTQRAPDGVEIEECLDLYRRLREEAGLDERQAMDRIALLALNLNEFIYLD